MWTQFDDLVIREGYPADEQQNKLHYRSRVGRGILTTLMGQSRVALETGDTDSLSRPNIHNSFGADVL